MAQTRTIRLKLFLEGIEVDVISAEVSAGINRPASAAILIPAAPGSHEFLPRTLVHLFYLDLGLSAVHEDGLARADPADPANWKLLFGGEVGAYGYRNQGGQRTIVLNCVDFSNYWSSAQLYWGGDRKGSFHTKKQAVFAGASVVTKGKKPGGTGTLLRILSSKPSTNPKLPGLLGGLVSLLESATGVYDGEKKATKNFRGVNEFMSHAELRLKLTRMIGAAPGDDTSQAFLGSSQFRKFFRRVSRSVGSTASYLQLMSILLDKVYHRWASVAAPPYIEKGAKVTVKIAKPRSGELFSNSNLTGLYAAAWAAMKITSKRLTQRHTAALSRTQGSEKELANLDYVALAVFGHSISAGEGLSSSDQDGSKAPLLVADVNAHGRYASEIPETGILEWTDERLSALQVEVMTKAKKNGPSAIAKALLVNAGLNAVKLANRLILIVINPGGSDPDNPFEGHILPNLRDIESYLTQAVRGMKAMSHGATTVETREMELDERLHAFLFTPDIYMVPPPRCNVIFPDHYGSVSFARNWLGETTRLWMFGRTKSGKDKKNVYFAPNVSMPGVKGAKTALEAVKKGHSIILPHEKFTGIVPAFEGLGDNDIFKTLHKRQVKAAKRRGGDEGDVAGRAAAHPQPHLQRAANFLFYAKRFQTRSISLECRFMPQLVPGLPALVLDPDSARVHSATVESDVKPVHYLGTVANLTHSINAAGGAVSSVQLTKCRVHNEDNLFGDPDEDKPEIKSYRSSEKELGPFHAPYRGKGPNGYAFIDHLTPELIAQYNPTFTPKRGAKYRYIPQDLRIESDQQYWNTPDGQNPDGHEPQGVPNPEEPAAFSPDPTFQVMVKEVTGTSSTKKVDWAFEDTITPPWFADIYRRDKIGADFYYPMVGCLAMTDQLDFAGGLTPVTENVSGGRVDAEQAERVKVPGFLLEGTGGVTQVAESLAELWVSIRDVGGDMDTFIEQYTLRKFASLRDMFGPGVNESLVFQVASTNLAFNLRAAKGDPGFHQDAFGVFSGKVGGAIGKFTEDALLVSPGEIGVRKEVGEGLDPRLERGARVMAYLNQLMLMGKADGQTG